MTDRGTMLEKKSGSLNWKRSFRLLPLVILMMAGIMPVCRAQTPQPAASAAPPAPGYSDAEKVFAARIAALPPEDALRTIASAESSRITEGLYRALKEIANQASAKDPHRAVAIFHESEATATRAGLPVLAADARFNQAFTMVAEGETYEAIAVYGQALTLYQAAGAPVQRTGQRVPQPCRRCFPPGGLAGRHRRRQRSFANLSSDRG